MDYTPLILLSVTCFALGLWFGWLFWSNDDDYDNDWN